MTTRELADRLCKLGFKDGDAVKDISDRPPAGLIYLTRQHEGQHQYLSIMTEPWVLDKSGRLLEAVLFVYEKPYNSKDKQKQIPLAGIIVRNIEEIETAVSRIYP